MVRWVKDSEVVDEEAQSTTIQNTLKIIEVASRTTGLRVDIQTMQEDIKFLKWQNAILAVSLVAFAMCVAAGVFNA